MVGAMLACIALAPSCSAATATSAESTKHKPKRAAATQPTYAQRADVRAFIDEMVTGYDFDRALLQRIFASARFQPQIVAAMQRPLLEPPKWYEYAPQFLSQARIDA